MRIHLNVCVNEFKMVWEAIGKAPTNLKLAAFEPLWNGKLGLYKGGVVKGFVGINIFIGHI